MEPLSSRPARIEMRIYNPKIELTTLIAPISTTARGRARWLV